MSIRYLASTLFLGVASAAVHAQATVPGWMYGINVTFDSGTGPANRGSMAMRYRTTASALRTEIVQISGTANRPAQGIDIEGFYTIVNDSDGTSTNVMPSQHVATIMPSVRALLEGMPLPAVDSKSTSQSIDDLGNGGIILGHATHHYRLTTRGTVTFTTGDGACTRSTDGVSELWIAPDLDIAPAMRSMVAHFGFIVPDSMQAQTPSSPMKGLPLRTKTRTTALLPSGESRVIETTMEYTELSNAPLDASLFAVPADYKVMDMRQQMAGMFAKAEDVAKVRGAATAGLCPK